MQLALLPCSNRIAFEHYVGTIQNPVQLNRILQYLPESDRSDVSATFGEAVAVWGVTPGVNAKKWARMQAGDIAMLYRDGRFILRGEVAYKVYSPDLARDLWQEKADGTTWEYVFFLTNLDQIDIDVGRFSQAAEYEPNYKVQSFNVLAPEHSEAIMDALDMEPATGPILPTGSEVEAARLALAKLEGELDLPASTRRRAEQSLLRKIRLGGKKSEACAICGRTLPVDLLVIGHIRKRHSCTPEQKRDEANVMPVCLLGCDKLFENGYVYVDASGLVQAAAVAVANNQLAPIVAGLTGKACLAWSPMSAPYFKLHREFPRRFI